MYGYRCAFVTAGLGVLEPRYVLLVTLSTAAKPVVLFEKRQIFARQVCTPSNVSASVGQRSF